MARRAETAGRPCDTGPLGAYKPSVTSVSRSDETRCSAVVALRALLAVASVNQAFKWIERGLRAFLRRNVARAVVPLGAW